MLDPRDLRPGQSQHERYFNKISKKWRVQYDYRDYNGKLYSAIGLTLQQAEEKVMKERMENQCVTANSQ